MDKGKNLKSYYSAYGNAIVNLVLFSFAFFFIKNVLQFSLSYTGKLLQFHVLDLILSLFTDA